MIANILAGSSMACDKAGSLANGAGVWSASAMPWNHLGVVGSYSSVGSRSKNNSFTKVISHPMAGSDADRFAEWRQSGMSGI